MSVDTIVETINRTCDYKEHLLLMSPTHLRHFRAHALAMGLSEGFVDDYLHRVYEYLISNESEDPIPYPDRDDMVTILDITLYEHTTHLHWESPQIQNLTHMAYCVSVELRDKLVRLPLHYHYDQTPFHYRGRRRAHLFFARYLTPKLPRRA